MLDLNGQASRGAGCLALQPAPTADCIPSLRFPWLAAYYSGELPVALQFISRERVDKVTYVLASSPEYRKGESFWENQALPVTTFNGALGVRLPPTGNRMTFVPHLSVASQQFATQGPASLFLLSSLCIGGSERKTVRIVNAMHSRGRNVHIAWLNSPETLRPEIRPDVPAICLERSGKFSIRALRRLECYVREHGVKRIICMNLYPLLYAKALRLVMGNAAPSCVVTVNTTEFASRKEALQMVLYAPLIRRADGVVFGSDYQLGLWVGRYRLPETMCRYIHNGVDSDHFSAHVLGSSDIDHRAAFDLGPEDFVVGTVGKLRPEKQQGDLIEAVARLRAKGLRALGLIVGGGEKELALKKQAADAGVSDFIRFPGEMHDVRPALAAMDVFVLTSLSETFSNAALEAMAMGRPVVLSDVGGAREMVLEGVNGHLYPPSDVVHLTSILGNLAADSHALRRMGEEARRIIVEQFSFSRMVDEYVGLHGDIILR